MALLGVSPAGRFRRRFLRSVPERHALDALGGALRAIDDASSSDMFRAAADAVSSSTGQEMRSAPSADDREARSHWFAGHARMLLELHRDGDADAALREAAALAPDDPWIADTAGYFALFRDERDAAMRCFKMALRLDRSGKTGQEGLMALDRMRRPWRASRTVLDRPRLCPAKRAGPINLVFFFVQPSAPPATDFDLRHQMQRVFQIARARCPGCAIVVLSDEETVFPDDLEVDRLIRAPAPSSGAMLQRMVRQRDFLRCDAGDRDTLFLDPDVVIANDLACVFGLDFDIALTTRYWPYPQYPFNGGVVFARPGPGALRFFDAAVSCYLDLIDAANAVPNTASLGDWWGDQLAFARLIDWSFFATCAQQAASIDGAKVTFLPWWTHNYTPFSLSELTARTDADTRIIHFKGDSKTIMWNYLAEAEGG